MQVFMPRGREDEARRFYSEAPGLQEVKKPPSLAGRGGCWCRAFDGENIIAEIHLGVEEPFHAAGKSHPGLVCESLKELEELASRIECNGYELSWAERGYI
ncbi:glyoxalase [Arthrobacter sp. NIO-1057]|uniref:glyoxalase n=1 Tax=Arthrobacter sp. NIO-1057 TaxID=993071 RepID=UPI0008182180|nr:hypothetical protein GA0061084_1003 [Arthrobacter sp. NIO-1057]